MTQGEIEGLSIITERAASRLEKEILLDIVRKIKINSEITSSAEWQIQRLRQIGVFDEYIKSQLQTYLKITEKEVENLYRDVVRNEYEKFDSIFKETGVKRIPFFENEEMQKLIEAILQQTENKFLNITNTLGFTGIQSGKKIFIPLADFFQKTLDNAILGILTGVFDYNTALVKAVKEMTRSGIRTIDYASGRSYRVESASRTALMTGFGQITGLMNEQTAKMLGTNDYEVTFHVGARPTHQIWQGKVYNYEELVDICGLGNATGLCGINCYHWYIPFVKGVSKRNYTDSWLEEQIRKENMIKEYKGKEYTTYTALQKQRSMELLMRKQRQEIVMLKEGKANEFDLIAAKSRYRSTMQQYTDFSKKMNLPQQNDRIYMDGLGKVSPGALSKPKRKEQNTGVFKGIEIPMQKRYVEIFAKKYGVRIDDMIVKIQRNEELLNLFFTGSTDYDQVGRIDLFPNAFISEEQLIRTIIHERCHVLQLRKYGKYYTQENLEKMEEIAYRFEEFWYNIVRRRVQQ